MMRQYFELKAKCPDCILFFRLGDFYEMFHEDAILAAELLQITLTARSKGVERVPMCGVPYHSARRYIAKLLEAGRKVAICEQVEAPGAGPGIVRREIVRTITPGTVLDEDVLDAGRNNFLAAVTWREGRAGAALLDVSTGEFFALEASSGTALAEDLAAHDPRELLVAEAMASSEALRALQAAFPKPLPVTTISEDAFVPARAAALLQAHFQVASLESYGLAQAPLAVGAAGAALRYVKDTQRADASHVDRIQRLTRGETLILDEASRANLEVLRTLREGSRKGSLLGVLDRTVTALGARTLVRWLTHPLCRIQEIQARLDAVQELTERGVWREELTGILRGVADLERLCGRLATGLGNARDLLALSQSLDALPELCRCLAGCQSSLWKSLCGSLTSFAELGDTLRRALLDEPVVATREGGMIRPGFHADLDAIVELSTQGKDYLLQLEQRERARTGISSLKVRFNRVFGYYLEVTRSHLERVPADYVRKQTTVGAERYVTPELKEYEERVLTAEERRGALEYQIFEALRAQVLQVGGRLRVAAQALAQMDVLRSLAVCAAEYGYVRPTLDLEPVLQVVEGRHPVVERMSRDDLFVPNDLNLDANDAQLIIITGPNMAGKSTVMRQAALIALMAQMGSFVPAKSARVGICDRIFTRVGAADNVAQGQSTFMVEMMETSNILHNATRQSLIILDEIGRGTSTFDGLSIAWAVAEHLHDRVGARALFATHYHELMELAHERRRVRNASVAVKETEGRVVFLRKLIPEGASRSYGIEVARLAGLPPEVLTRAREILLNLESGEWDEAGRPRIAHAAFGHPEQLGLFPGKMPELAALSVSHAEVLGSLRDLDVNALTPLAALNLLAELHQKARL